MRSGRPHGGLLPQEATDGAAAHLLAQRLPREASRMKSTGTAGGREQERKVQPAGRPAHLRIPISTSQHKATGPSCSPLFAPLLSHHVLVRVGRAAAGKGAANEWQGYVFEARHAVGTVGRRLPGGTLTTGCTVAPPACCCTAPWDTGSASCDRRAAAAGFREKAAGQGRGRRDAGGRFMSCRQAAWGALTWWPGWGIAGPADTPGTRRSQALERRSRVYCAHEEGAGAACQEASLLPRGKPSCPQPAPPSGDTAALPKRASLPLTRGCTRSCLPRSRSPRRSGGRWGSPRGTRCRPRRSCKPWSRWCWSIVLPGTRRTRRRQVGC